MRRTPALVPVLVALFALGAAACDDRPTGPDVSVEVGTLAFLSESRSPVSAPSSVPADSSFEATVFTVGSGCTTRAHTEVDRLEDGVLIVPFDRTRLGVPCLAIGRLISHTVTVSAREPGELVVRARGRSGRADPGDEFVVVEQTVTVTPR